VGSATSDEEIPVVQIHKLRDEMTLAIASQKWKTTRNRANSISELIVLAMDPVTCRAGSPHIDGVCAVGTQEFAAAPEKTKAALQKMNELIRSNRKVGKKKKKGK
jgi:hypothetical protein